MCMTILQSGNTKYKLIQLPWETEPDISTLDKNTTLVFWYKQEARFFNVEDFHNLTEYDLFETNPMQDSVHKDLKNFLEIYKLENYIYIDCNHRNQELYPERCIYMPNYLFGRTIIPNVSSRPYMFSTFNRRVSIPRLKIIDFLKKKNCIWSGGYFDLSDPNLTDDLVETAKLFPKTVDKDFTAIGTKMNTPLELYQLADFHIINETDTWYDPNYMFITEKTYNCFASYTPFVLCGQPYTLEHLRDLGFKTFNNWWDEGYDSIKSTNDRILAIFDVINYIEKNAETIKPKLNSVLEHNASIMTKFNEYPFYMDKILETRSFRSESK